MTSTLAQTIARNVKFQTVLQKITLRQLESLSSIKNGQISRIINGKRTPTIGNLESFAKALQVSPEVLCDHNKPSMDDLEIAAYGMFDDGEGGATADECYFNGNEKHFKIGTRKPSFYDIIAMVPEGDVDGSHFVVEELENLTFEQANDSVIKLEQKYPTVCVEWVN